jgi:sugar/nucleoside kinase (ribokinase family)
VNSKREIFDVVYIGNYTKDTIVSPAGESHVDGGGAHYAAVAAARLGWKTAAVTRLAREDQYVVRMLEAAGVTVFARYAPSSTCVRLEYPTDDVDVRDMYVTSFAGPIESREVEAVEARAAVLGTSVRGEVGLEVIRLLRRRGGMLAADMQGFIRVLRGARVQHASWPEMGAVLACLDVVKVDAVEAEFLAGEADLHAACRNLARMGPTEIVLTHKNGVVVYDHGEYQEAAFYPARMNGRSGRGDTFLGTYVAMRLSSPPSVAIRWAAAVTSLKMETLGPFMRTRNEVEDLLRRAYGFDPSANAAGPPVA